MRKNEALKIDTITTELYFLRIAIERDDPKEELLRRIDDTNLVLAELLPNK